MCHSTDSRPPAPPVVGEVASHGTTELVSGDGTRVLAYRAEPVTPNGRSVVILPDIRGLHPYYRDLAVRFAEAGFRVIAIDYFGRTAGDDDDRGEAFDWQSKIGEVTPEQVRLDVAAAAKELPGPVFTVGFCFGGSQSWWLGANGNGLAGAIGFYGAIRRIGDLPDTPGAPILLLRGGADTASTDEEFETFTATLDRAGTENETHIYPGAPHSFFDRSFAEWSDACADAWRQILSFTERHAPPR
ncbi:dienelactone hydrolase [Acrocarpospora corrugata]|uniref:Dienelactone hydrolase n=1 Tax=Acrocarpospora corrugata TaxID=35763 RepID=A0A5M3W9B5_9ACTN|nr:dienelactone hydrolase family protein [Acrocarpospora corrugata]GES04820.1 dienelactone hydrolase [Acrocarpospora corrugata]